MIAYCGLKCDTCPIFIATGEKNSAKKRKMRVEIADICNRNYGMNLKPSEITDCDGCTTDKGRLFSGCIDCIIRKCAINKSMDNCAFCPDYPCLNLKNHFLIDPESKNRLKELCPKTGEGYIFGEGYTT